MKKYSMYIVIGMFAVMSFSACGKENPGNDQSTLAGSNLIVDTEDGVGTADTDLVGDEDIKNADSSLESNASQGEELVDSDIDENSESEQSSETAGNTETEEVTPTRKPVKERSTEMYVVLKDYGSVVKVRAGAGTDTEELGILVHAEKVYVIKTEGDWAQIFYKDGYGYCMVKFLTDEKPAYLTPPPVKQKGAETPAATTKPETTITDGADQEQEAPPEI